MGPGRNDGDETMRKSTSTRTGRTMRGDQFAKRGFAVWIVAYAALVLTLGVMQGITGKASRADTLDTTFTATVRVAPSAK